MKIFLLVCIIIISCFDLCYTSCGNGNEKLIINTKLHFDIPNLLKKNASWESLVKAQTSRLLLSTESLLLRPALYLPIQFRIIESKVIWSMANLKSEKVVSFDLLFNYCTWQKTYKQTRNNTWWFSVLVTDADLHDQTASGITYIVDGRANIRQFCSLGCLLIKYSPSIVELAYKLAHELAHSFGVMHDTVDQSMSVMAPIFEPNNPIPNTWSTKSRAQAEAYIMSNEGWCFGDSKLRKKILDENK